MAGLFRPDRARAVELPGNVIDTTSPGIHTDMLLTSPQRIPHARHLVATAFALALVNDGWKLHSPPGKFYLENDGKQIQPFQLHSERSGCYVPCKSSRALAQRCHLPPERERAYSFPSHYRNPHLLQGYGRASRLRFFKVGCQHDI